MTGHMYKKKRAAAADEQLVIMHEGDSGSSLTSESDNGDRQASSRQYVRGFRQRLDVFLHSTKFQVFIVALVIFNCLVVIVELLINLRVFEPEQQDRTAANILRYINIGILGFFVTEMAAKIIAADVSFVKRRMEVFDLIVILASFTLSLTFSNQGDNAAHGVSLLIMLRLWRATKILNSMVSTVRQDADRRMAKERRARKALEREVYKLREYCLQQECELQMYRLMLQQNGIALPTVLRVPSAPRTLSVIAEVNEQQFLLDQEQRRLFHQQQLQRYAAEIDEATDLRSVCSSAASCRSNTPEVHQASGAA